MAVNIKIKNMAQIRSAFLLSPAIMSKNLNKAIARVVIQISRDSRIETPVDTGRLRASHYTRFSNLKGEVGTNVKYDHWVHDGTKFMPARPYLQKAVDKNENFIDREFKEAVQDTLDDIARRI